MYVVTVAPLTRGTNAAGLTYYTATECAVGMIVRAPIRGREVTALVIDTEPVSRSKTALKAATFTLRKLPPDPISGAIPASLIALAHRLHDRYPATLGSILFALLPAEVRTGTMQYPTQEQTKSDTNEPYSEEQQVLIATTHERYTRYQSQIRTAFAHGGSILMVVPTAAEVASAQIALNTGIQERVVTLSPHQTPNQRRTAWKTAHQGTHPILLITTPGYAYLERSDTTHIIIERAGHTTYRTRTRPYLDQIEALQTLAKITNRTCVIGDTVLRTETEYARRNDDLPSLFEPPKRLMPPGRLQVIREPEALPTDQSFRHLFPDTVDRLTQALNTRQNVFLYAPRRGIAPVIACLDCGSLVRCPDSGNPYSLIRTHQDGTEQRWFVDTASGRRVRAADTCAHCGSWRLRERGIGIQQIEDILPQYFPHTPVITFDANTANTPKKIQVLKRQLEEARGSIILGTAMILPYLPQTILHTCVTSLEAAASIPSWRADEFFFRLLLELREKTQGDVLLQARHEPSPLVELASQGSIERFYTEELALRTQLQYPPFAKLILLTWSGTVSQVTSIEADITKHLPERTIHFYTHPLSQTEKVIKYGLLRIPHEQWPDTDLLTQLRSLPPHIKVQTDPDQII